MRRTTRVAWTRESIHLRAYQGARGTAKRSAISRTSLTRNMARAPHVHYTDDVAAEAEPESTEDFADRGFRGAPVTASIFITLAGVFAAEVWLAGDWQYAIGGPDGEP